MIIEKIIDDRRSVVAEHLKLYPLMDILDVVKLLYQHELGCEHSIGDPFGAYHSLEREYSALRQQELPLLVDIGNGFSRVELRALAANGVDIRQVFDWFYKSSAYRGSRERFISSLELLRDGTLGFDFSRERVEDFFAYYRSGGFPPVHHSARYSAAYAPAYRVVRTELVEASINI